MMHICGCLWLNPPPDDRATGGTATSYPNAPPLQKASIDLYPPFVALVADAPPIHGASNDLTPPLDGATLPAPPVQNAKSDL